MPSAQQKSGGRKPPPPPPAAAIPSPPKSPPRRGSRSTTGDRSTLLHLRRSELAGWRTKSVFPSQRDGLNSSCFLPILKLRGLPFFCTRKHVAQWLGDLATYLKDLIFVLEVDSLTTGFGLVTFHTSQAAYEAWQKLHRAPIVGKRFVEVFALFPPHCPLSRRDSLGMGRSLEVTPSSLATTVTMSLSQQHEAPDPAQICCFCGFPYGQHGDGGTAAFATRRLRRLMNIGVIASLPGLMHTAFLKVPALLFQDAGLVSCHEVDLFDPDQRREAKHISEDGLVCLDGLDPSTQGDRSTFFDLMQVESYHMRLLISEISDILFNQAKHIGSNTWLGTHPPRHLGTLSIAEIGNRLSTRARAYLFLTETKLKNVLETFAEFFVLTDPVGTYPFYSVSLSAQLLTRGTVMIWSMQPYQLSRRGRRRESGRKTGNDILRMQTSSLGASSHPMTAPGLPQHRATSCAVSRATDLDSLVINPKLHRRNRTPPSPLPISKLHNSLHEDDDLNPISANEPLSQALVDFIKSLPGLDSIISADACASSSRRFSQWTLNTIPPQLEQLSANNRSSTCPGTATFHQCQWNSPSYGSYDTLNKPEVAHLNGTSLPTRSTGFAPTLVRTVSANVEAGDLERQKLLASLLRQREEVDARIEQALTLPAASIITSSSYSSKAFHGSPSLILHQQCVDSPSVFSAPSEGLGCFATDLSPIHTLPLVYQPIELATNLTDLTLELEELAATDMNSEDHDLNKVSVTSEGSGVPPGFTHLASELPQSLNNFNHQ